MLIKDKLYNLDKAFFPCSSQHADPLKRNLIFIKVFLCDKCFYSCDYCYNIFPRSGRSIDIDDLLFFIDSVNAKTHRNIFIELIGGEPTLHPQFIELCECLNKKKYIDTIFIYTTFYQPLAYIQKIISIDKVDLQITWHGLKNDKLNKDFYDKAKQLRKTIKYCGLHCKGLTLSIMYEPNNIVNSIMMFNLVSSLGYNTSILLVGSLNKINDTHRYVYSQSDLDKYFKLNSFTSYDIELVSSAGVHKQLSFDQIMFLIDTEQLSFINWKCNAGIDRLYVHCNGEVYPCQQYFESGINCQTYSIKDGYVVNNMPITCSSKVCWCEGYVKKYI